MGRLSFRIVLQFRCKVAYGFSKGVLPFSLGNCNKKEYVLFNLEKTLTVKSVIICHTFYYIKKPFFSLKLRITNS